MKGVESIGFQVNPYDVCEANRLVNDTQYTVVWHVDNIKSSHMQPKVKDRFLNQLQDSYAKDEIGEVKNTRGKIHNYLRMTLAFTINKKLWIDMTQYIGDMVQAFPDRLNGYATSP